MLIVGDDNETRRFPIVNITVIAICTLITIWTYVSLNAETVIKMHGCVPARFFSHQNMSEYLTLISSMFLHAGFIHLVGNMWYLYIFGDNIEDHFGHFNYAAFYVTCGIVSGLAQMGSEPGSLLPSVGASGAIAGVLGAYLVLYPHARVKTWWGDDSLFFAFRSYMVPSWIVIGGWFALQYICMNAKIPGIGWHAHIFGFLTGIVIVGVYRICGEKCSDNDSASHMGNFAHYPSSSSTSSSNQTHGAAVSIAKPVTVILLSGALVFGGTFYLMERASGKTAAISKATATTAEHPASKASTTTIQTPPLSSAKSKKRPAHGVVPTRRAMHGIAPTRQKTSHR